MIELEMKKYCIDEITSVMYQTQTFNKNNIQFSELPTVSSQSL